MITVFIVFLTDQMQNRSIWYVVIRPGLVRYILNKWWWSPVIAQLYEWLWHDHWKCLSVVHLQDCIYASCMVSRHQITLGDNALDKSSIFGSCKCVSSRKTQFCGCKLYGHWPLPKFCLPNEGVKVLVEIWHNVLSPWVTCTPWNTINPGSSPGQGDI